VSRLLDRIGQYLAQRKGLLPLLGAALVAANYAAGLIIPQSWVAATDLMLHVGVILAILGLLLARVL
jgi:hypothetical protein